LKRQYSWYGKARSVDCEIYQVSEFLVYSVFLLVQVKWG